MHHIHPSSSSMLMAADVLHLTRLDWAFAGTSSSEIRTDSHGKPVVHSTWYHWIDSGTPNAESVKDEGDMFPQTDGRTIEKGKMVNPATGRMTNYEECWEDVEPVATSTESDERSQGEGKRVCAVLQLHDDANKARGMVVRVGQFCQGFLRVGEYLSVERWSWTEEGGWQRERRIGSLWVPCGILLKDTEKLAVGDRVTHGEFVWKVVETGMF